MTLQSAITAVLEALDRGEPAPAEALDFLRAEVAEPRVCWGVQTVGCDERPEPEEISYGTRSEMAAWNDALQWADGWSDPATFDTEEEALDHIGEHFDDEDDD
jgi:hypothetical protein